jgi:5'-3' exonuclease
MGIPGLFRTILKKYPNTIEWKCMKTDYYFMDFNSFMHNAIGKYISKNKEKLSKLSQAKIENEIIKNLINKTQEIVKIVKPKKLLYIAIDGSAPLAKMSQQRARRYKGILMNDYLQILRKKYKIKKDVPIVNSEVWDSVGISPGTKFMKKVSTAFQKAIKSGKFCKHLKNIADFKIMFSDTNMPGEAEHKIMMFIRMLIEKGLQESDKITIYSEDADLIVLNFPYPYNIRIQRPVKNEDRDKYPKELPKDVNYIYFLVDKFKEALINEVGWNNLDIDRVVYDYIFLSLMGGNDFVKPLPYLKVNTKLWGKDGLSNIINYYNNVKQPNQYLINSNFTVNTQMFKALINEMAKHEDKAMKILYKKMLNVRPMNKEEKNKSPIDKNIADFEHNYYLLPTNPYHEEYKDEFKKINYNLPYLQWKKQYYEHFFGSNSNKNIKTICSIYIKSLLFSFYYYLNGIPPSWRWTYPFRVSPLLSDLRTYLRNINDINVLNKWKLNEPFLPLEQLFMILSPKNIKLLPTSYQKAMLKPPLNIYYPSTITLDVVSGGKYAYSEPILPEIEYENMLKELKKLKLTKTDINRNQLIVNPYIYGC